MHINLFSLGEKAVLILQGEALKSCYACQWSFDSLADTELLILQFFKTFAYYPAVYVKIPDNGSTK